MNFLIACLATAVELGEVVGGGRALKGKYINIHEFSHYLAACFARSYSATSPPTVWGGERFPKAIHHNPC